MIEMVRTNCVNIFVFMLLNFIYMSRLLGLPPVHIEQLTITAGEIKEQGCPVSFLHIPDAFNSPFIATV